LYVIVLVLPLKITALEGTQIFFYSNLVLLNKIIKFLLLTKKAITRIVIKGLINWSVTEMSQENGRPTHHQRRKEMIARRAPPEKCNFNAHDSEGYCSDITLKINTMT